MIPDHLPTAENAQNSQFYITKYQKCKKNPADFAQKDQFYIGIVMKDWIF